MRIEETLRHLALQQVPQEILWEIIVVDNASTDNTAQIAKKTWERLIPVSGLLVVIEELRPGKNFAFRKGIEASKYGFVLTCDDDNWLSPTYIADAYRIMGTDPKIGALGGRGIFEPQQPVVPEILPYESYYVNGSQSSAADRHWVYGAGSVYRKNILEALYKRGWRQVTMGRKGNSLICGEDVEICFMIYLSGYAITADDCLTFKHFVPKERQNIEYILRLSYGHGYTNVLLNSYFAILNKDQRPFSDVLHKWLISTAKALIKNHLKRFIDILKEKRATTPEHLMAERSLRGTWHALLSSQRKITDHHLKTKALIAKMEVKNAK